MVLTADFTYELSDLYKYYNITIVYNKSLPKLPKVSILLHMPHMNTIADLPKTMSCVTGIQYGIWVTNELVV